MKKLVLALTAVAAFTGSAIAADMAPRTYSKAPAPVSAAANWTGLWVSGGFGYEMMQYQHSETAATAPFALFSQSLDTSGKGWLGKVGLGYDYQFMGNFVIGAFADAQWSNVSGQAAFACPFTGCAGAFAYTGQIKNDWSWGAGGRIGYVALPGLLTYFNAGYTQAHFNQTNYADAFASSALFGTNTGLVLPSRTKSGYFLGGGTEYAISQIPGLFWKNEVRFSDFGSKTDSQFCTITTANCGGVLAVHSLQQNHVYEEAATTEIVYRFNWNGPVVAKY
jgi:outer membrane immunogenic protein